ncbi:hypothetical protein PoB_002577200 [Plakobranchus ocellatus]|uniref:Uncharacterized protein n=1 Tax=Plakobranchus ocellatus TaxID=259542 RepID=A0AAV3ZX55_9GAST|nr:hypothetical protein PoB_002577200 [Plakobranchus ocellatus]
MGLQTIETLASSSKTHCQLQHLWNLFQTLSKSGSYSREWLVTKGGHPDSTTAERERVLRRAGSQKKHGIASATWVLLQSNSLSES